VRTSGAEAGVASVVVVVVVVVVVGAGVVFGLGVVLVVVLGEAGSDGPGSEGTGSDGAGSDGGAGTVVVPLADAPVSEGLTVAVASATLASISAISAMRSGGSAAVRDRLIVI
jgi:hypothetical protein